MAHLAARVSAWRQAAHDNLAQDGVPTHGPGAGPGNVAALSREIMARIEELEVALARDDPAAALAQALALGEACGALRSTAAARIRAARPQVVAAGFEAELERLLQDTAQEMFPLKGGLMLTAIERRRLYDTFRNRYPEFADEPVVWARAKRLGIWQ
jgi:HPt (histidine-containing phosphotransfer) domain-containing protein